MDTFQDDIYVLADYPPIHTLKIRQRVYSIIGNRGKFNIQVSTNNLSAFFKYSGKNIHSVNLGVL